MRQLDFVWSIQGRHGPPVIISMPHSGRLEVPVPERDQGCAQAQEASGEIVSSIAKEYLDAG